jgi:hypothetical protein
VFVVLLTRRALDGNLWTTGPSAFDSVLIYEPYFTCRVTPANPATAMIPEEASLSSTLELEIAIHSSCVQRRLGYPCQLRID